MTERLNSANQKANIVDLLAVRDSKLAELGGELVLDGFRYAREGLTTIGLPEVYDEMARRYFGDTDIMIMETPITDEFPEGSCMTVGRKAAEDMRTKGEWHRIMALHPDHIAYNYDVLHEAIQDPTEEKDWTAGVMLDQAVKARIALLWTVFSQVAGIASEAIYTVNVHDGWYAPSFNGHSPYFNAQKYASKLYKANNPSQVVDVAKDTMQLRHGLGLYLLGGFLRSSGIVGNEAVCETVIDSIIRTERNRLLRTTLDEARAHPLDLTNIQLRLRDVPLPDGSASLREQKVAPDRYKGFFLVKSQDIDPSS